MIPRDCIAQVNTVKRTLRMQLSIYITDFKLAEFPLFLLLLFFIVLVLVLLLVIIIISTIIFLILLFLLLRFSLL